MIFPNPEDMKDYHLLAPHTQERFKEQYAESLPYLERIAELAEQLDVIRKELRDSHIWSLFCPDYETQDMVERLGFYETWLPSALDC